MTNISEAIVNIENNPVVAIRNHYTARNRANSVGEALELFVKDAFANTIQEEDEQVKIQDLAKYFLGLEIKIIHLTL